MSDSGVVEWVLDVCVVGLILKIQVFENRLFNKIYGPVRDKGEDRTALWVAMIISGYCE